MLWVLSITTSSSCWMEPSALTERSIPKPAPSMPGVPERRVRRHRSQRSNPRDERLLLHIGISSHAFELLPEAYVCVDTRRVFVEVQESLRSTVEDATLLLDQSG